MVKKSKSNSPQHSHYIAIVAIVAVVAVVILVMNSMKTSTPVEDMAMEEGALVGEAKSAYEIIKESEKLTAKTYDEDDDSKDDYKKYDQTSSKAATGEVGKFRKMPVLPAPPVPVEEEYIGSGPANLEWKCGADRVFNCVTDLDDLCWCEYKSNCYSYGIEKNPDQENMCISSSQINSDFCTPTVKNTPDEYCRVRSYPSLNLGRFIPTTCWHDRWEEDCDNGPYYNDVYVGNSFMRVDSGIIARQLAEESLEEVGDEMFFWLEDQERGWRVYKSIKIVYR